MSRQRWTFAALALLVLGWLAFALRPDPVEVELAEVRREPLVVSVDEQGRTRARESFAVAAPIAGRLLRTEVEEGDRVERGDVLATMLPPPEDPRQTAALRAELAVAEAREAEARAALAEARSAQRRAQREAERRRALFAEGAVSAEIREQYDQAALAANARLRTASAALRAASAEVGRVRARLIAVDAALDGADAGQAVRAPIAGTVLAVHQESERVVPAGTPLFEISEERGIEIVVDLLTEEAVRVERGALVHVTGWGGPPLEGRVRYVEPKGFEEVSALGVEEQRVNVIVDLVDSPASLGAEFRVEAAIETWRGEDVLTVPTSAMFRRGNAWRTFVASAGRAVLRTVEIGQRGSERAEVLGGLEAGDRVIVFPSDLVEDGVRVRARNGSEAEG